MNGKLYLIRGISLKKKKKRSLHAVLEAGKSKIKVQQITYLVSTVFLDHRCSLLTVSSDSRRSKAAIWGLLKEH